MRSEATQEEVTFYRNLGERLRRRRLARGITLATAGDALGVPHNHLSAIELATRRGQMYTVARYAHFLGMRPLELFAEHFADVAPVTER